MSGNQSAQTSLSSDRFEFEVEIEDPATGLTTNFTMEVDTGNPIALALPRHCEHFFTDKMGTVNMSGAGSMQSPAYNARVTAIDSIQMDYETMAVMTLTDSDYGLLGIELLKHMKTEIYDDPDSKKLRLEATHI